MDGAVKKSVSARLRRIEGQVSGLLRMMAEDRACVDVLTQINAVRAALYQVEQRILADHVSHCVAGAVASGDEAERRRKIGELIEAVGRMTR
jgi:DNA-binding FrmR family transcriptional regulator